MKFNNLVFLLVSRPLYRFHDIAFNHIARISFTKSALSQLADESLNELNQERIQHQKVLNEIGASHGHICAECKGKCCGGVRERDSFIDRILLDPSTKYTSARRKTGKPIPLEGKLLPENSVSVLSAEAVEGYCFELTVQGCRIPYHLRPMQCAAYFCGKAISALTDDDIKRGLKALDGLMNVKRRVAALALKSRFARKG